MAPPENKDNPRTEERGGNRFPATINLSVESVQKVGEHLVVQTPVVTSCFVAQAVVRLVK